MATVIEFPSLSLAQSAYTMLKKHSQHIKVVNFDVGTSLIISPDNLSEYSLPEATGIHHVHSAYPLASLALHPEKTRVQVGSVTIGGPDPIIIAGPCSVESREQLLMVANHAALHGCHLLRGGAFKPRTSPYSFQGLGIEGLRLLAEARKHVQLPIVTEVLSVEDLPLVLEYADMLQVGARNMQNFPLLSAIGKTRKPVLLKRNPSATLDTWLQSAEYILAEGNSQVVLCERGVCSSGAVGGHHLDLEAVLRLRKLTHLPVVVDPSHGTRNRQYVIPMALAASVLGADGIMVEVHPDPVRALSDGPQSLTLPGLATLMTSLNQLTRTFHQSAIHESR